MIARDGEGERFLISKRTSKNWAKKHFITGNHDIELCFVAFFVGLFVALNFGGTFMEHFIRHTFERVVLNILSFHLLSRA